MENREKTNAKDFFLHLGVMGALYVSIIALLNILFNVINTAYPQIDSYRSSNISFAAASLIVAFPIFLVLAKLVYKSFESNQEKREMWIRKWLVVLTLFVAGVVLAGDLITLLYYFLDGRELTTGFLLKVLSVLAVSAAVFGYFLEDFKERMSASKRKIWFISSAVAVLLSIVLGFSVIGSPQSQRLSRLDSQKVGDLQNIQSQVVSFWQAKGQLPETLDELNDSISYFSVPMDPQTNESYLYNKTGELTFELCAEFNRSSIEAESQARPLYQELVSDKKWEHGEGLTCFEREIDPDFYQQKPIPVF